VPKVDKLTAKTILNSVSQAIDKGYLESCHDCSEGGLAVAIAEMSIGGNLGAKIFLEEVPKDKNMLDYEVLFSESASRFIVEVNKSKQKEFEQSLGDLPFGLIGCVSDKTSLIVYDKDCKEIINSQVEDLRGAWMKIFDEFR